MNIREFIFWQTMDNNKSKKNQKENEDLTHEIAIRSLNLMQFNREKTTLLLQYHIQDWEYQNNGRILRKSDAQKQAIETFYKYKECGYIDEWNRIREDLAEYIK